MTSATGSPRAFTLVEITLACLILTIALSVAWPSVRGFCRRAQDRARARDFSLAVRQAREMALITGTPQRVDTPEGGVLTIDPGNPGDGDA